MGKIQASQLERKAFVYVRQSSPAPVQHHGESTLRQYRLQERARRLGWKAEQIEVIDEDQGKSGAKAVGREGFQRLVSEVALDRVGVILGLEVSRLARSCADWYRLLEVATLAGTLIADEEGVYDPRHYNDRLLLGLKGTLSEAELHFLKQRMIGGRRNKAERGEYRIRLPVGYVWEPDEGIRLDPDERVRESVDLFFRTFDRLGTAQALSRYFEDHQLLFPRRDGWGSLQVAVTWGKLSTSRALLILHHPVYAGVYVYNRNASEEVDPEDSCAGGRIWIPNAHPAYITIEQHEQNGARLQANRTIWTDGEGQPGSVREGKSLVQGIVLCGRCGRHMQVGYDRKRSPIYTCRLSATGRLCQQLRGRHVDPLIEQVLLETLTQEQLELAVGALEQLEQRSEELDRQWRKRLEQARYEADKAARRYYQVEPENRLVSRTLEAEWNLRLEEVEQIQQEYNRVREKPPLKLNPQQRQQILALAEDLPRLWKAPTTRQSRRKQLLRLLIEDVTLSNVDVPWSVSVAIRWKTEVVSRHQAERVLPRPHRTPQCAVVRIEQLYCTQTDRQIALILNSEGHRTGYGNTFTESAVAHIRHRRGLKKRASSLS